AQRTSARRGRDDVGARRMAQYPVIKGRYLAADGTRTSSAVPRKCAAGTCYPVMFENAKVAELADAPDLGSGSRKGYGGSSPPFATSARREWRAELQC